MLRLAQGNGQRRRVMLRMAREDEVGCGGQVSKPSFAMSAISASRLFMTTALRVVSKCAVSSIAATAPAIARRSSGGS